MKKAIIALLFFIFLFITTVFAEISIRAEVDKTSITTDEYLTYKLVITSSEKNIPKPQVPKFENFRVISQAQSSTVSFGKGNIKTIVVYAFILSAVDIGKFQIKASSLKLKDKAYSTDAFEIAVRQGKIKPPPKIEPSLPQEPAEESEGTQITL